MASWLHTVYMLQPEVEQHLQRLQHYFLAENKHINLTALRTEDACWHGNILDSIAGQAAIEKYTKTGDTIADIGTGGGFPLLPLAIMFPNRTWVGIDSVQKKIAAIERIAISSTIGNAQFVSERLEDIGQQKQHREQYSAVTSRAVAPLATLLELMAPLAVVGGHLLCWKSVHIQEEMLASLTARSALDCHLVETISYTLPGDWGTRQLLVFQKIKATKKQYPRENGTPKKDPL